MLILAPRRHKWPRRDFDGCERDDRNVFDTKIAVFRQFSPKGTRVVGIALRAERKNVDKITKGARMHP